MKKRINLEISQPGESAKIFKALSLPIRISILQSLMEKPNGYNISELAEKFSLPFSTAALHVRVLEDAGLILIQEKPGYRGGSQKNCSILVQDLYMNIFSQWKFENPTRNISFNMPLGSYYDFSVTRPCGMAGRKSRFGIDDTTQPFYSPHRIHAQLIWFSSGYLEYRFPNHFVHDNVLSQLAFSFEACSEAPGYNHDWPSDITVWINNNEVFTFRSTGDYGDKRGIYNPDWWPNGATQYGELHHLDISTEGCFGDRRKSSDISLESLELDKGDYISFKIGVKEDAEFVGGINLFGEHFGNYKQNINMTAKLKR